MEMASPSPGAVPVEDEYEYALSPIKRFSKQVLMPGLSYETLPPNFSLADNMLAGAFAGIAVLHPLLRS